MFGKENSKTNYNAWSGSKADATPEKMLRLENGEWATLNQQNLTQWVADYPDLQKAIKAIAADKTAELLPRMVLTYNERNPFYLK